ncbi:MAG: YIP1 family protein [Gammaproteobacteria bacterium]|nr:YIP1 family protein [Gammaproteobacteria bacterium]
MNLVDRVKNIILKPKDEWLVIDGEQTTTADLYRNYILILAAIGPICTLIGISMIGMTLPFYGTIRIGFGSALTSSIVGYGLALAGVFIVAQIINALAPSFGGQKDDMQALKVTAYAYTPAWIGGVFSLLPALSIIGLLLSIYGLYVLYLGLPVLMKAPAEKALGYTAVVIVCAIVVYIVIAWIAGSFVSMPQLTMPPR